MSSFQIARCIFPSIFLSSLSSTWKVFAPYFDFFFLRVFFLNLANILFIVSSSSLRVPLLSIFFRKLDLLSVSIWFTFEPLSWWGFSCSIKVSLCLSILSIVSLLAVLKKLASFSEYFENWGPRPSTRYVSKLLRRDLCLNKNFLATFQKNAEIVARFSTFVCNLGPGHQHSIFFLFGLS